MGRVARLILLVVVSVYVVFCVLCFLQNNLVFSSVTISHILKNENYEICFLAGFFVDQIKTGKNYGHKKKRYSRLAVGWNKSPIIVCRVKIQTPTITGKITTRKKRYSRLAIGWNKSQITVCCVKIRTPTTTRKTTTVKKKVRSFATHVTF
jgi:hypothetical protein